jgi:hypothetical protein
MLIAVTVQRVRWVLFYVCFLAEEVGGGEAYHNKYLNMNYWLNAPCMMHMLIFRRILRRTRLCVCLLACIRPCTLVTYQWMSDWLRGWIDKWVSEWVRKEMYGIPFFLRCSHINRIFSNFLIVLSFLDNQHDLSAVHVPWHGLSRLQGASGKDVAKVD